MPAARSRASFLVTPGRCAEMPSAICRPIRYTGLREFIAPWNTIARSCQRVARSCWSFSVRMSVCCPDRSVKMTSPPVMRPGGGSSRVAAYASVDLPQPDSPARPSTSPRLRVSETWRSTCVGSSSYP